MEGVARIPGLRGPSIKGQDRKAFCLPKVTRADKSTYIIARIINEVSPISQETA